jgi:putative peptidoglycan lipid II flippase
VSVSRNAGVMALGTIASRLTGLVRNALFISLGLGVLTDAYNLANNSPNMFYELVVGGVLSATLVPLFVRLLAKPAERISGGADATGASAVVTLAVAAVVFMSIALFVGAPFIISLVGGSKAWAPGQREFAVALLRMFAPQVGLYGCVTLSTALLHSRSRFGITMAAPILNNVVVSAVFLWARHRTHGFVNARGDIDLIAMRADKMLMWVLGWGTTLGVAVTLLATIPALRTAQLGLRPTWQPSHPAVRELLRLSGWTMGYVAANQVALLFITRVAKGGNDADLSAYTSANSLFFQLPYGVIAVSIMAGIQPILSRSFINRKRAEFRRQLSRGVRTLVVLMTPAAAGYVVLAKPITELVAAHGATSVEKALLIGRVLTALAPGLPAFSVYLLFMNALKAMLDTRATFEVNIVENAINIAVGAVLYKYFGIAGLGAAFAVAYVIAAVIAGIAVSKRTAGIHARELWTTIGRTLIATSVMIVSVLIVGQLLTKVLPRAAVVDLTKPTNRMGTLVVFISVSACVGVASYIGTARLVGITEMAPVFSRLAKLVRPTRLTRERR